jgi:hypothetical protein
MGAVRFAAMGKLTWLAIVFAAGITLAPAAQGAPCDSNHSDACVPVDSDVDCASGSGNGPSYVAGPVIVVGNDITALIETAMGPRANNRAALVGADVSTRGRDVDVEPFPAPARRRHSWRLITV